jgi:hypothetical protein
MKVKAVSLLIGVTKIAELMEVTITFKANGEIIPVSDEVIKSKGVTTTDLSFETVAPVGGYGVDMVRAMIEQNDTSILIPMLGAFFSATGTFDEASIKSIVKSGMTTGSFKWSGGTPTIQ